MRSDMHRLPGPDRFAPLVNATLAMTDRAFELDANEAAGIIAAFNQARAAGHPFDPFTVALVEVLRRQIAETFEGFEDDISVDDGFENDAADEEPVDDDSEPDGEQYSVAFDVATRTALTGGTGRYRKVRVA